MASRPHWIVRLVTDTDRLEANIRAAQRKIKAASEQAAQDVAAAILQRGRADIQAAGNFGTRWTEGLQAPVHVGKKIVVSVQHTVPYWRVFQTGKVIKGKPLLWIPLSHAQEAQGVSAKDYPGRLFRTTRKSDGLPLLGSVDDKEMKYFGKESVTIPKKFHLVEIAREEAQKYGALYRYNYTGHK